MKNEERKSNSYNIKICFPPEESMKQKNADIELSQKPFPSNLIPNPDLKYCKFGNHQKLGGLTLAVQGRLATTLLDSSIVSASVALPDKLVLFILTLFPLQHFHIFHSTRNSARHNRIRTRYN